MRSILTRESVVLVLITLAAYGNSLAAALPFDSGALVHDDVRMAEPAGQAVTHILTQNYWGKRFASGLYRPIASLTYLAQRGSKPWAYHAVNLFLHLVAVLLVYALFRSLFGHLLPAFLAAAIWAVHPLNTEAVTNVAGRPDLLMVIGVSAGLLSYFKSPTTADSGRKGTALLSSMTLLAVFSKESGVVLLPLALLVDWWQRREVDWNRLLGGILIPIGFMLGVRTCLSISCGMALPFVDNPLVGAGFLQAKMTAICAMCKLLWLWIWPLQTLSADYSYSQIPLWSGGWIAAGLFGCLLLAGAVCMAFEFLLHLALKRWRATSLFFVLFALIAYLPTSNLLFPIGTVMAERFLYLPGIGLAGLAGWWLSKIRHKDALVAAAILCVGVPMIRTADRNRDYRDDLTFWKATAAASPRSFKAHTQLAVEYRKRGDLQNAVKEADQVRAILAPVPDRQNAFEPWTELWGYYQEAGQEGKAREAANRVAAIFTAAPRCKRGCDSAGR